MGSGGETGGVHTYAEASSRRQEHEVFGGFDPARGGDQRYSLFVLDLPLVLGCPLRRSLGCRLLAGLDEKGGYPDIHVHR